MPKYEVVLAAGLDFPLGMEFESDNLHPVMRQHVRQIGGKTDKVESESKDPNVELDAREFGKLWGEAVKLNKAFDAAKAAAAKKAATESPPVNGPGENT